MRMRRVRDGPDLKPTSKIGSRALCMLDTHFRVICACHEIQTFSRFEHVVMYTFRLLLFVAGTRVIPVAAVSQVSHGISLAQ
jgi:hypothetical protein